MHMSGCSPFCRIYSPSILSYELVSFLESVADLLLETELLVNDDSQKLVHSQLS
jgi:hypothetical protein